MTILTSYQPISYSGDGTSTNFPITWPYQSFGQIVVATKVIATGVSTPAVYGTDYTVSPTGNSPAATGTVVLTVALPVGSDVLISRNTSVTQNTKWTPNDPNPSTATENAVDKSTMIAQEQQYEIDNFSGGSSTGIVTTAVFAIAPIGIGQSIFVNDVSSLHPGNVIQVSNITNTMIGQISSMNIPALQLIVVTLAITSGVAGNTMPIGSPVQLSIVPGTGTTITVQDAIVAPSTVTGLEFTGQPAIFEQNPVQMYVTGVTAGVATIAGNVDPGALHPDTLQLPIAFQGNGDQIIVLDSTSNVGRVSGPGAINHGFVLTDSPITGHLVWKQLDAGLSLLPSTLLPTALLATNSPSDTQIPSYDLATGHWTWVNPGGGGSVPGSGTSGNFLRGPGLTSADWSHVLNTSAIDGFVLANAETNGTYGTIISNYAITPSPFHWNVLIGQALRTSGSWAPAAGGMVILSSPTMITESGTAINYQQLETPNQEGLQTLGTTCGYIRAAAGVRMKHGPWQFAYTIPSTTGTVALDLINGSYQRQASVSGNITYTIADTTSVPSLSGFQFASELTIEINAPGANTITWPGNVTWANGGSAPTLNTTGINIVRLVRRQGLTQFVGYVEGGTFSLTAGIINSTTYFAALSVPISAINASGTPSSSTVLFGNGTWGTPTGSIIAQNIGSTISGGPFTTLNFASNISGTNAGGGVLNISASGGGGPAGQQNLSWDANGTSIHSSTGGLQSAGQFAVINVAGTGVTGTWSSFIPSQLTLKVNDGVGVNVVNYGADPTGVTDSTAAFTAAYAAAASTSGNGKTMRIPAGSYSINATLSFGSNVNIIGDGCWAGTFGTVNNTTITYTGGSAITMMRFPSLMNGVKIGGFTLDGGGNALVCMEINNAQSCVFEDISVRNFSSSGSAIGIYINCNTQIIAGNVFQRMLSQTSSYGATTAATGGVAWKIWTTVWASNTHDVTQNRFSECTAEHSNIGFYIGFADGNVFDHCLGFHLTAPSYRINNAYDINYDFVLDSQDSLSTGSPAGNAFNGENFFNYPGGSFRALASVNAGLGPKATLTYWDLGDGTWPARVDGNIASQSWIHWIVTNINWNGTGNIFSGIPHMNFADVVTYGPGSVTTESTLNGTVPSAPGLRVVTGWDTQQGGGPYQMVESPGSGGTVFAPKKLGSATISGSLVVTLN
jgi:hypothetical protein